MNFKTVILYNERRIRPQTIEAIKNAKDGDMIPVDVSEMGSFLPLVVHEPSLVKQKAKALVDEKGHSK